MRCQRLGALFQGFPARHQGFELLRDLRRAGVGGGDLRARPGVEAGFTHGLQQRALLETMSESGFYSRPGAEIAAANARAAQIAQQLETLMARWETLEQRA